MKRLTVVLIAILFVLMAIPTFVQGDDFVEPFTCDPYTFTFDFPLKCNSPYDSVQYTMLVRSTLDQAQTITVSMWPEYTGGASARSEWFTIEPVTGPLPGKSVVAFTITCAPPYCELEDKEYRTYLKVSTVYADGYYWDRPLGVHVRIGDAVPVVDYGIEAFKLAQINGQEKTAYTQDQITITVWNNGATPNEFCLYPVNPGPPTGTPDEWSGDFATLQTLWRDPAARSVSGQPVESSYNSSSKKYNQYTLYLEDGTEFGAFLGASYNRESDEIMYCYPFRVAPKNDEEIPFTLWVNKDVPSGIYRLQIHVKPCGISTESTTGSTGVGIEYECKMILRVNRGIMGKQPSGSKAWIGLVAFGGLIGMWGMMRVGKLGVQRFKARKNGS